VTSGIPGNECNLKDIIHSYTAVIIHNVGTLLYLILYQTFEISLFFLNDKSKSIKMCYSHSTMYVICNQ